MIYTVLYVDDLLIGYTSNAKGTEINSALSKYITLKDLVDTPLVLGFKKNSLKPSTKGASTRSLSVMYFESATGTVVFFTFASRQLSSVLLNGLVSIQRFPAASRMFLVRTWVILLGVKRQKARSIVTWLVPWYTYLVCHVLTPVCQYVNYRSTLTRRHKHTWKLQWVCFVI